MKENPTLLELDATFDNLQPVRETVCAAAQSLGYAGEQLLKIEVVVEEAYLNVVHHAYHDQGGRVVVTCELNERGQFQVAIIDYAPPFAVDAANTAGFGDALDVRLPGGCGMTLIRSMTRSAIWRREDDRNLLSMLFDPPTPGSGQP